MTNHLIKHQLRYPRWLLTATSTAQHRGTARRRAALPHRLAMEQRFANRPVTSFPQNVRQIQAPGPGQRAGNVPAQAASHRPLVMTTGQRTPRPSNPLPVPGSVPVYPIFNPPQRPPQVSSRTSSKQSVGATFAAPLSHEEPRPAQRPAAPAALVAALVAAPAAPAKAPAPAAPDSAAPAALKEPLLKVEKLEVPKAQTEALKSEKEVPKVTVDLELGAAEQGGGAAGAEWCGWPWLRSLLLLAAGVVLWIYPQRWASVFLLLLALLLMPTLGVALRGGLALPHVGMRRVIASWLLDFGIGIGSAIQEQEKTWKPKLDKALARDSDFTQGVNRYALQVAGNVGQAVLQEKSEWMPAMVDAVGDIVPPALSRVMEKKDEWTPALTTMVGEIVPSVMRGVLSNHQTWSPALMQLVGDVVPPVLTSVLKNREWTPALLEFVGEVVPVIVALVLRRPELPPAIAAFIDGAGPSLGPAVVRLIDFIIMDPKLMQTIRKMTDNSMRDEALVNNIKTVIESSLKEGTMYRAVGHGLVAAAEQSLEHMGQRTREKLSMRG